jgi:PGF-pre-PGF domain-containing protein
VPGVNVSAKVSGNVVDSTDTDSNGYYEVQVPDDYSGQDFKVYVDGSQEQTYTFSSGQSDKLDVSSGYSLSVSLSDDSVDEGNSISLSPSVTNGRSPSYSWSFPGDDNGASLTGSGSSVTFEAPDDVDSDTDTDVEVKVTNDGGETDTATATITIEDTDEDNQQNNGGQQQQEEEQQEGEQQQDQQGEDSNQSDSGEDQESEDGQGQDSSEDSTREVDASAENGKANAQIDNVNPGETVQVNIPDESAADGDSSIESVSFSSSTSASNVQVEVEDKGSNFESVSQSVNNQKPQGQVYSYQNIEVSNVDDNNIDQATVSFKVKKSFLENNDATVGDVRLQRYNQEWSVYDAESTGETETHYQFESQTPGFSTYAITLEEQEEKQKGVVGQLLIPIAALVIVLGLIAGVYRYRDEIQEAVQTENSESSQGSSGYSYDE